MAYTYDSDMRLIRDTDIRHIRADVAARGLDVADVEWVVQYDPPQDPDITGFDFTVSPVLTERMVAVHRVGRAGRMGKGQSSVNHAPRRILRRLHVLTRRPPYPAAYDSTYAAYGASQPYPLPNDSTNAANGGARREESGLPLPQRAPLPPGTASLPSHPRRNQFRPTTSWYKLYCRLGFSCLISPSPALIAPLESAEGTLGPVAPYAKSLPHTA
eukprot:3932606-Rhodomonas_salina.5